MAVLSIFLHEKKSFFKEFFISKYLELEALQMLKISAKFRTTFVSVIDMRWKYPHGLYFPVESNC
jgi:hypothetical protein